MYKILNNLQKAERKNKSKAIKREEISSLLRPPFLFTFSGCCVFNEVLLGSCLNIEWGGILFIHCGLTYRILWKLIKSYERTAEKKFVRLEEIMFYWSVCEEFKIHWVRIKIAKSSMISVRKSFWEILFKIFLNFKLNDFKKFKFNDFQKNRI